MGFGACRSPRRSCASSTRSGWELYHVAEDFSETTNVAAEHRDKLIEMIALWYAEAGKYNVLPIDSRGTARLVDERPQLAHDRATATSTTRARRRCRTRSRRACSTGRTASPRRWRSPNGAEGVLRRAGRHRRAATRSTSRTTSCTTPTTTSACSSSTSRPTPTVADGRHELRFEFEPTGKPDLAHGKGTPARAQLYVDGKLAGAGRSAGHHPARHRHHRGPDRAGATTARRSRPTTEAPFAFTGDAREGRRRRLGRAHRGQGRRDARR